MQNSLKWLGLLALVITFLAPTTGEANAWRQRRVAPPTIAYNPPRPLTPGVSLYPQVGTPSLAPVYSFYPTYVYPYYSVYYPSWSAGYYVTPGAFTTTVSPWGTYYYYANPGVYYWYRIR